MISKKNKEYSASMVEDVSEAFGILLASSRTATKRAVVEGLFDRVSLLAWNYNETYHHELVKEEDGINIAESSWWKEKTIVMMRLLKNSFCGSGDVMDEELMAGTVMMPTDAKPSLRQKETPDLINNLVHLYQWASYDLDSEVFRTVTEVMITLGS